MGRAPIRDEVDRLILGLVGSAAVASKIAAALSIPLLKAQRYQAAALKRFAGPAKGRRAFHAMSHEAYLKDALMQAERAVEEALDVGSFSGAAQFKQIAKAAHADLVPVTAEPSAQLASTQSSLDYYRGLLDRTQTLLDRAVPRDFASLSRRAIQLREQVDRLEQADRDSNPSRPDALPEEAFRARLETAFERMPIQHLEIAVTTWGRRTGVKLLGVAKGGLAEDGSE